MDTSISLKRRLDTLPDFLPPCIKRFRSDISHSLPHGAVLTEPGEGIHNDGRDNAEHDLICRVGDEICKPDGSAAYQVVGRLGMGTFGQVVKCRRSAEGPLVALKITKQKGEYPEMVEGFQDEVKIMKALRDAEGLAGKEHIIRLIDAFDYHGHVCMALELLGPDLLQILQARGNPGMPLDFIRSVSAQLLKALQNLCSVPLIHGDLKPENVLVTNTTESIVDVVRNPHVKVIDFGASQNRARVMESDDIVIQTLPYRAPEVLLGLSYTCSADTWSLGCICAELFLGTSMFPHGESEQDTVRRTMSLLGPLPPHMLQAGRHTERYFERFDRRRCDTHGGGSRRPWRRLRDLVSNLLWSSWSRSEHAEFRLKVQPRDAQGDMSPSLEQSLSKARYEVISRSWALWRSPRRLRRDEFQLQYRRRQCFFDFMRRTLQMNPEQRWSPDEALRHPFMASSPPRRRWS